ncbi:unnamed protein product [Prorocentrum cordatum]|uniref:Uncharacterized protein n=1 Tax=Prorocentrum cordatum TaxID=2364126 RepID=A0ABN9X3P4_9DINO|nr:unnamed protein product [Polarella glacialis]
MSVLILKHELEAFRCGFEASKAKDPGGSHGLRLAPAAAHGRARRGLRAWPCRGPGSRRARGLARGARRALARQHGGGGGGGPPRGGRTARRWPCDAASRARGGHRAEGGGRREGGRREEGRPTGRARR